MIFILQNFLFGSDGIYLHAETLPLRAFYIILSMSTLCHSDLDTLSSISLPECMHVALIKIKSMI